LIAGLRKMVAYATCRWLAVLLWMGVIFALSDIPSLASSFEPFYDLILRKLSHMAEYMLLTALLFWALRPFMAHRAHILLTATLIAVLYACSDEWHQTFVPGREGTLHDIGIDALGIIGACLYSLDRTRLLGRDFKESRQS